jgi:hypothetical protein
MIEMVKRGAVPESVLKIASHGGLSLELPEQLEILVHLAGDPKFAYQARQTLAAMPADKLIPVVSEQGCPRAVLAYFMSPAGRRQDLLKHLAANPAVPMGTIVNTVAQATQAEVEQLLSTERVQASHEALAAAIENASTAEEQRGEHDLYDAPLRDFVTEHEETIRVEEQEAKPFTLTLEPAAEIVQEANQGEAKQEEEPERESVLQKLSRMKVADRVKTAFLGNREERAILIRDSSRVVSSAVLASPKITDQEVETFASLKNVQESVLRGIATNRKFVKNYSVVRNLVNNPRLPIDLGMNLIKLLNLQDLRTLPGNKGLSDVLRKMAQKAVVERTKR